MRLSTSFNQHYWNSAVNVLDAKFKAAQPEGHYARALQPKEDRRSWWQTEEAATILANKMREVPNIRKRSLQAAGEADRKGRTEFVDASWPCSTPAISASTLTRKAGVDKRARSAGHRATSRRRSSRRTTRVNLGRATASRYTSVQLPTTARELAIFTSSTSQPF